MKCKCNDCGTEFEYDYKISICKDCLLKYNGEEFDRFCNKCKKKIATIKKSVTENNYIDVRKNCMKEKHFCAECSHTN